MDKDTSTGIVEIIGNSLCNLPLSYKEVSVCASPETMDSIIKAIAEMPHAKKADLLKADTGLKVHFFRFLEMEKNEIIIMQGNARSFRIPLKFDFD